MSGLLSLLTCHPLRAQLEFEREPISYETTPPQDRLTRLQEQLDAGRASLSWHDRHGWLPSLLEHLEVRRSSQVLVFSKTSLQLSRITPRRPRAIYFSDDTYVGWVQNGDVVELSSIDPRQGAIFYTLSQKPSDRPRLTRDRGQCLICHASSRTQGVPGHLVRSVFPAMDGQPHFGLGTFTTDHTTPFENRFGGWYVTGTHGAMRHMGNVVARDDSRDPLDREAGANVTSLSGIVNTAPYLEPGSDLVALMVLEHQTLMHNVLTLASYETRMALHYDSVMNKALDRPADHRSESTERRIRSVAEKLLKAALFCGEFTLESPIQGTSVFAREFQESGLRDSQGRSLRDFDLTRRLFKYPCSFLIDSEAWSQLPPAVGGLVETRLQAILSGEDQSPEFSHLSREDRTAIREILADTRRQRLSSQETSPLELNQP